MENCILFPLESVPLLSPLAARKFPVSSDMLTPKSPVDLLINWSGRWSNHKSQLPRLGGIDAIHDVFRLSTEVSKEMLTPLILNDPAPDPPSETAVEIGIIKNHGSVDTPQFVGAGNSIRSIVVKLSNLKEIGCICRTTKHNRGAPPVDFDLICRLVVISFCGITNGVLDCGQDTAKTVQAADRNLGIVDRKITISHWRMKGAEESVRPLTLFCCGLAPYIQGTNLA